MVNFQCVLACLVVLFIRFIFQNFDTAFARAKRLKTTFFLHLSYLSH